MKRLLALLLLLLSAHAGAACTPVTPSPYPWLKVRSTAGGSVAAQWYACAEGGFSYRTKVLDDAVLDPMLDASTATDAATALAAAWQSLPASSPRYVAIMAPVLPVIQAVKPVAPAASSPPPSAWVVNPDASNPAATVRSAYPLVNGKRSIVSDTTARVGAPCSCATYVIEGLAVFCAIPPESLSPAVVGTRVAGCHKQ